MTTLRGKVSWFGGPDDKGVDPDEGLAFIYDASEAPHLFLPQQPPNTTGLARRLDPDVHYIACRWDYDETPKEILPYMIVEVRAPKTGLSLKAFPADWGPHIDTGRIADISPGLMESLGISTDDEVEVTYYPDITQEGKPVTTQPPYQAIAISSGHSLHCRGAAGVLDEVNEARRIVDALADELKLRGITVATFHDDASTSQGENLDRIVDWHNSQERDLDVSVHLNAYIETTKPMGTEVLYVSQDELASDLSAAIASCGFLNRGGKYRDDLAFLNGTDKPSVLLEICFVDSEADAEVYEDQFETICSEIADVLGGTEHAAVPIPPAEATPPSPGAPTPPYRLGRRRNPGRVDLQISGNVVVTINGRVVAPIN